MKGRASGCLRSDAVSFSFMDDYPENGSEGSDAGGIQAICHRKMAENPLGSGGFNLME